MAGAALKQGRSRPGSPPRLGAGDRVPAFTLAADEGQTLSRESLKGRPYLLYFYPRDDTAGCTREAADFSASLGKFSKLGVAVIGVSRDSLESHAKFRSKHKLKIALASDPDIEAAQAFGAWGEKSLYGRKFMGLERSTFLVGADGRIAAAWRKVRVPGHVEAVLAEAKKL